MRREEEERERGNPSNWQQGAMSQAEGYTSVSESGPAVKFISLRFSIVNHWNMQLLWLCLTVCLSFCCPSASSPLTSLSASLFVVCLLKMSYNLSNVTGQDQESTAWLSNMLMSRRRMFTMLIFLVQYLLISTKPKVQLRLMRKPLTFSYKSIDDEDDGTS